MKYVEHEIHGVIPQIMYTEPLRKPTGEDQLHQVINHLGRAVQLKSFNNFIVLLGSGASEVFANMARKRNISTGEVAPIAIAYYKNIELTRDTHPDINILAGYSKNGGVGTTFHQFDREAPVPTWANRMDGIEPLRQLTFGKGLSEIIADLAEAQGTTKTIVVQRSLSLFRAASQASREENTFAAVNTEGQPVRIWNLARSG